MARESQVRRHADGALDIGYHRRRARQLRNMARRRAWRVLLRVLQGACRGLVMAAPRVEHVATRRC
jgi:hypothetical protein